ncbi:TIGR04552 family protein [bacterium]|nr:TIGR04552 family protein [bacterium]
MSDISQKYRFPWSLFHDAFSGSSVIDTRYMMVKSIEDAELTLDYYGFSWKDDLDRAKLIDAFERSIHFVENVLLTPYLKQLSIPLDVKHCKDLRQILYWTNPRTRNRQNHLWSCAILKIVHSILHLESESFSQYFQEARSQVFDRFNGHIRVDDQNKFYFGQSNDNLIPLHFFEVKREKNFESKLIKLLHKAENTAARIFDHIGVRIVTESIIDTLIVFQYLSTSKIFTFANIAANRSKNTLLDLNKCQKHIQKLRRNYSRGFLDDQAFEDAMNTELQRDKFLNHTSSNNPFSLDAYRSVQFTCRHLVKFTNPNYTKLHQLFNNVKSMNAPLSVLQEIQNIMATTQQRIEFFFPFEIQLMDRVSFLENQEGSASHQVYKASQLTEVRQRLFGRILETMNIKPIENEQNPKQEEEVSQS